MSFDSPDGAEGPQDEYFVVFHFHLHGFTFHSPSVFFTPLFVAYARSLPLVFRSSFSNKVFLVVF